MELPKQPLEVILDTQIVSGGAGEEARAESSSSEEEEGAQEDLWARARGLAGPQSSGDSSGSGSEADSDEADESSGAPEVVSEARSSFLAEEHRKLSSKSSFCRCTFWEANASEKEGI